MLFLSRWQVFILIGTELPCFCPPESRNRILLANRPHSLLTLLAQISTCMKFLPVATILFYFINFVRVATLKNGYNSGNKISHRCLTVKCKIIRLKILMLTYITDFIYTSRSTQCKNQCVKFSVV